MTALQPDRETRAEWMKNVTAFVDDFIEGLENTPSSALDRDVDTRLLAPPPEGPGELTDLLARFASAASHAVETAGPRYFAYFPAGGLFSSVLGETVAQVVNRFTAVADLAPSLVAMEHGVLRWLCDEFGLPETAGGVITTGASVATLSALHAAREDRLGGHDPRGTIYVTAHTHYAVAKAARIAGFAADRVREVPVDAELRMNVDAAKAMIDADRASGEKPFLIVGTAGSTSTGTIDPLDRIADITDDLWFHVDGAYGASFQLTERGKALLNGIDRADSITFDPHKSLFLPYGTGVLLTRDIARLRAAHVADGEYLQDIDRGSGLPDYGDLGPELTREFRGMRLWLPLHLHGVGAFRAELDEKLDLAAQVHREIGADPNLVVPLSPDLTVVVFRSKHGEQATQRILDHVNGSGRAFLSSTRLGGEHTLRLCVLSHRQHAQHVAELVELIRETARSQARTPSRRA